jgi:ketosteroid isomerase-like protein
MSTIAIPNDFQEMVDRLKAAMQSLVEGDPEPFKALTSQADDVTIFGALGVYKRGKDEARQDTEWVASRFHGARKISIETLALGASGDLGYSAWLERGEVRLVGREDYAPIALRVTHIFRRENGEWKIIHRHGDGVMQRSDMPPIQR